MIGTAASVVFDPVVPKPDGVVIDRFDKKEKLQGVDIIWNRVAFTTIAQELWPSKISARYEHGSFGESIRLSGPVAKLNPYRWSTKYTDEKSGLANFGRRHYNAPLGHWMSRDPIAEGGGNIGGLILMTDHPASDQHFFVYDGNGNVVALARAASPTITARYEYSPFSENIRRSGTGIKSNPYRWSTKFADDEMGLSCNWRSPPRHQNG